MGIYRNNLSQAKLWSNDMGEQATTKKAREKVITTKQNSTKRIHQICLFYTYGCFGSYDRHITTKIISTANRYEHILQTKTADRQMN